VLAVDEHSGRVVGFVTALTDGVQAAFIPLLEVLPEHRGQGVGSELMRRVLDRLADLPAVDLTCRPEMQAFYARFEMRPSVGAVLRRH
jgi:ribosomal protein S18 acetylase RimI-like enzyme